MKKLMLLICITLLMATPALSQENELSLDRLIAFTAAGCPNGFDGAPDPATAWCVMSLYCANVKGCADGEFISVDEMASIYNGIFAEGSFADIQDQWSLGCFGSADNGYTFRAADGDPFVEAIKNDAEAREDGSVVYDVSLYELVHSDFPMYFKCNAKAVTVPGTAEGSVRLKSYEPIGLPVFTGAESNAQLGDQEGNSYGAENAIDGRNETCWAYTLSKCPDAYLRLTAQEVQAVRGVVLTSGYAKNEQVFRKNRRAAEIRVTLDDGNEFTFHLNDVEDDEFFDGAYVLPFHQVCYTAGVTVEVTDTYEGSRHDDVCISEIYFF